MLTDLVEPTGSVEHATVWFERLIRKSIMTPTSSHTHIHTSTHHQPHHTPLVHSKSHQNSNDKYLFKYEKSSNHKNNIKFIFLYLYLLNLEKKNLKLFVNLKIKKDREWSLISKNYVCNFPPKSAIEVFIRIIKLMSNLCLKLSLISIFIFTYF